MTKECHDRADSDTSRGRDEYLRVNTEVKLRTGQHAAETAHLSQNTTTSQKTE